MIERTPQQSEEHHTQPDVPTLIENTKKSIRENMKEWMNEWASGDTGRIMFQHMTTPKLKDSIN